ncbi:sulfatase-like hydrolase/transferase, partial [Mariniblastus sp.]|nr:sulfatase-like hydrolase/transferase [Mariniblastus sp.]
MIRTQLPVFALLVFVAGLFAGRLDADEKPNIIFIFADDWGYGDLSCHDSSFCETPHLDQMANEGIDFQNFTVNS